MRQQGEPVPAASLAEEATHINARRALGMPFGSRRKRPQLLFRQDDGASGRSPACPPFQRYAIRRIRLKKWKDAFLE